MPQECMKVMPPHVLAAPPKTEGQEAPFALKDALPVLLQEERQAAEEVAVAESEAEIEDKEAQVPLEVLQEPAAGQHHRDASEQMAKRQRTMTACA